MNDFLFELIQVAIGNRRELTRLLSADEWAQLRLEFKKQALLGFGYCGIVRLPQHQTPPIQVLAQWVHNAEKIRKKNERLTKLFCTASRRFLVRIASVFSRYIIGNARFLWLILREKVGF